MKTTFIATVYIVKKDAKRNENGWFDNIDIEEKSYTLILTSENAPSGYPPIGQRYFFKDEEDVGHDPDQFIVETVTPIHSYKKDEWNMRIDFESIFLEHDDKSDLDYFKEIGFEVR